LALFLAVIAAVWGFAAPSTALAAST
jgi:hypothetical protein